MDKGKILIKDLTNMFYVQMETSLMRYVVPGPGARDEYLNRIDRISILHPMKFDGEKYSISLIDGEWANDAPISKFWLMVSVEDGINRMLSFYFYPCESEDKVKKVYAKTKKYAFDYRLLENIHGAERDGSVRYKYKLVDLNKVV
jgi:hypothetical protein